MTCRQNLGPVYHCVQANEHDASSQLAGPAPQYAVMPGIRKSLLEVSKRRAISVFNFSYLAC
jgi:hypothetical protein